MSTMPSSRRDFLWGASAVAATGAVIAAPGGAQAAQVVRNPGDFEPGLPLGPCRLTRVLPVEQGALPFELEDPAGLRFIVEVHRRDAGVAGLRPAGSYDVFLRNGGTGSTPTNETHGLGAMALASLVAAREASGRLIPELATIVERWSSDPPPMFR